MDFDNEIRSKVDAGEPVFGAQIATQSATAIEIVGNLGLDFVWIDLEHKGPSANDGYALEDLVRAAEVRDTEILVRVPEYDETMINTVLNCGVDNILVAQVESAEEVREIVRATHFEVGGEPGGRGASYSRSNDWGNKPEDYASRADAQKCVGVMVESKRAVDNIDEIVDVPGLDFVRIGYADLSISLGRPYQTDHEDVIEYVDRLEAACKGTDVTLSRKLADPDDVGEMLDAGYSIFTVGRDLQIVEDELSERYRNVLANVT